MQLLQLIRFNPWSKYGQWNFVINLIAAKSNRIILLVLLIPFITISQPNNYSACGDQAGVWNFDTVFVTCDVVVPSNEVLSISSGTVVLFSGHYKIMVEGALQAMGVENNPICFSIIDTLGFSDIHTPQGGWGGIRLENIPANSDSSFFNHCRFEFGKAVVDSLYRYGGAVCVRDFNFVRFSDCVFENNYAFYRGGAIYAEKSDMRIEKCLFLGNYAGNDSLIYGYGGALKFVTASPDIRHCEFYQNESTGIGGAVSFEFSDPTMTNCIFRYNSSALGGAIGYLRSTPTNMNVNLLVLDNYAAFFGGGIATVAASPMFSNLSLSGNFAAMGGGLYCNEASSPKLFNSIIWENEAHDIFGSQIWLWDTESEPAFYNCTVQYGIEAFGGSGMMFEGPFVDCIEDDPLFTDPIAMDYTLTAASPCINTGMADTTGLGLPWYDLAMNARLSGGRLDMGAYEFQENVLVGSLNAIFKHVKVYPIPLESATVICFELDSPTVLTIELLDISGKQIVIQQAGSFNKGQHIIQLNKYVNIEQLQSGVYLLGIHTVETSKWLRVAV